MAATTGTRYDFLNELFNNQEAINDLNTYRNWGVFGLQDEPIFDGGKKKGMTGKVGAADSVSGYAVENPEEWFTNHDGNKYVGTKSLFNNVNAVSLGLGGGNRGFRVANNMPLLDTQAMRSAIRERGGCSIKELCEASEKGLMGRAIYNYSDFMYCKHLGKVSNNYLITLRRFPFPCGDHINFTKWGPDQDGVYGKGVPDEYNTNKHMPDQGRLVTWMGTPGNDLNEILKYSVLMPYEEMQAQVQTSQGGGENGGFLGAVCNLSNPSYQKGVLKGSAGSGAIGILNSAIGSPTLPKWMGGGSAIAGPNNTDWAYHHDVTKPYGPVDTITKTHMRRSPEKGGLEFEQEINLCFDYELRSYDGINGKAAMLDLLANILAVTYTNGRFWGGTIHANGPSQSSLFTNLPIFHMKSPASFNSLKDASLKSVQQIAQSFNGNKPVKSADDVVNMAKNLLSNIGNLLLGGALNALGRPQKEALDSLLNNNPVGLWHLTIGNPKHPIMSMGNMILTKVELQHYGPLGLDDFPTGLKVNITLKHAMPRDRMKIEQMYTMGDYRLYIPQGKNIQYMYESADEMSRLKNNKETDVLDGVQEAYTRDMTDKADTESNYTSDSSSAIGKRYMKYFGTLDKMAIGKNSREGHMGSSTAKTNAQAKADADVLRKENDSNK